MIEPIFCIRATFAPVLEATIATVFFPRNVTQTGTLKINSLTHLGRTRRRQRVLPGEDFSPEKRQNESRAPSNGNAALSLMPCQRGGENLFA